MRVCIENVVSEITTLPGSSQVAVSHNLFLPSSLRGQGRGYAAMHPRLNYIFSDLLYDMVICTIESTNEAQKKILTRHGWKKCDEFKSRKTEHTVELWSLSFTSWIDDQTRKFLCTSLT